VSNASSSIMIRMRRSAGGTNLFCSPAGPRSTRRMIHLCRQTRRETPMACRKASSWLTMIRAPS
jgi:hypothetical protein